MVKSIKLETFLSRAVLIGAGFVCLIGIFFFVKWCLANAIAAHAPAKEVAALAVDLAPRDPQTHYALAVLDEKSFLPQDLPESLAEYERATALAPGDFRLWLALGKASERNGDRAGAELALRKALELAPNYAAVQWTLANVLLRRGKTGEAFSEMRKAAENDAAYESATVGTAWQISGGNLADVRQNIGDSAKLNAALALFLASQKRFDDALQIWNALLLPDDEKKSSLKEIGGQLSASMLGAKRFRDALLIGQSVGENAEAAENFAVGKIYNGGFEQDVKREKAGAFDWQIADGAQPQIGFDDSQKRAGNRSLVVIFDSPNGRDFRQILQTIVVEARRKYVFEAFYKSDLKTAATVHWEISDAADGKILAATVAVTENADWMQLNAEFMASESTQAVVLRLVREQCKSVICPVSGKVWFDDFSLR